MNDTPTMRVPVVTPVPAGRDIPSDYTDWEISGFRNIRMVDKRDRQFRITVVPIEGDSLKHLGILDGDLAVMRMTSIYEPEKLGIWQTPHGRTIKFAYYDLEDNFILTNNDTWQQQWDPSEVRLLGVVIRVERDLE